ncbi:hypothetical protein ABT297_01075 [Dactylosporangium sp. NPDC000555]|uniref:hypothetical protein n=1 Tax=Dactylosporangium sp. NPDC000555 TaxID=3154260 RepID=UPI0033245907
MKVLSEPDARHHKSVEWSLQSVSSDGRSVIVLVRTDGCLMIAGAAIQEARRP